MKRKVWWVAAVVATGLAFPISNLILGVPVRATYMELATETPLEARAKEIFAGKCVMCHMDDPGLPFYASFPVASSLIRRHVTDGTAIWNAWELIAAHGAQEVSLAKLEQSVLLDTMPILPYLLMHWDSALSAREKKDLLAWVREVRAKRFARGLASAAFASWPIQPLPDRWPEELDPKKLRLGEMLCHDKRLSTDDTLACAGCHELTKGGTDQRQFSIGVRNQVGGINAPTVFNAVFNLAQFWDGRARDLADQAGGPPFNPIEMASNWSEIVGKLSKDAELTALMKEAYGDVEWGPEPVTHAIAEFEKTLITPDSPVDRHLKGEKGVLTDEEAAGLALFRDHSCATCHTGESMGGKSFERPKDPAAFYAALGRAPVHDDFGRYNVTTNEADRFKMKVPNLRNIALTFPYLHDDSQTDLRKVVRLMHDHFVPELNRRRMSDADVGRIVAMLMKNTGQLHGRPL